MAPCQIEIVEGATHLFEEPGHQSAKTWREHADINNVMLATSLAPEGYL